MLLRFFLSLALLVAAVIGVFYYRAAKQLDVLHGDLKSSHSLIDQQQVDLIKSKADNLNLKQALVKMDSYLGIAKTRLTRAEADKVQLDRELAKLRTRLHEDDYRSNQLISDIASLHAAIARAKEDRASPESVAAFQWTIEELKGKLAAANEKLNSLPVALPKPDGLVLTTNRSRSSIVVSVGPSSAFVVINYGASHGALPSQIMTIQRGTKTLASALITDVRQNHSIAQIQPDSLRGALHKGDSAVLAK